jgi:hypothetical protein
MVLDVPVLRLEVPVAVLDLPVVAVNFPVMMEPKGRKQKTVVTCPLQTESSFSPPP